MLDLDREHNALVTSHCGCGSPGLADANGYNLQPVRLANNGVCIRYAAKPGPVTYVNLVGRRGNYRLCAIEGEAVPTGMVFEGNPLRFELKSPLDKVWGAVDEFGFGHHWMTVYAHASEVLVEFCKLIRCGRRLPRPGCIYRGKCMNSRERFLAAIQRKPVDRVPLYLRLWSMHEGTDNIPFDWQNQFTRAENLLKLGVDDTLLLEPPLGYTEEYHADLVPGISSSVTKLPPLEFETDPRLRKVFETPDGPFTITVKQSADWIHGDDVMLFSDFNLPRQTEPFIKEIEDVKRLRHLLANLRRHKLLNSDSAPAWSTGRRNGWAWLSMAAGRRSGMRLFGCVEPITFSIGRCWNRRSWRSFSMRSSNGK